MYNFKSSLQSCSSTLCILQLNSFQLLFGAFAILHNFWVNLLPCFLHSIFAIVIFQPHQYFQDITHTFHNARCATVHPQFSLKLSLRSELSSCCSSISGRLCRSIFVLTLHDLFIKKLREMYMKWDHDESVNRRPGVIRKSTQVLFQVQSNTCSTTEKAWSLGCCVVFGPFGTVNIFFQ